MSLDHFEGGFPSKAGWRTPPSSCCRWEEGRVESSQGQAINPGRANCLLFEPNAGFPDIRGQSRDGPRKGWRGISASNDGDGMATLMAMMRLDGGEEKRAARARAISCDSTEGLVTGRGTVAKSQIGK